MENVEISISFVVDVPGWKGSITKTEYIHIEDTEDYEMKKDNAVKSAMSVFATKWRVEYD
jgi:hypothetical protein